MKKALPALVILALLPAGIALAEDDDCRTPRDQWQPREAVMKLAEENGWTIRDIEAEDGCYEVEARDKDGRDFEVKIDPGTLKIVDREDDDDDDDDGKGKGQRAAPAGTVAPPANGLFAPGAKPQVQVK